MKKKDSKKQGTPLTKTDLKSALKEQSSDFQRYVGAVSEDFQHKTTIIAEQYISIKETLDSHTKILDSHTKTLDSHTKTLDSHTKILDSHTKTLDSHTEMIGSLAIRMANIEQTVAIIKDDTELIKSGLKKKVDQEEFDSLVRRVSILEKQKR